MASKDLLKQRKTGEKAQTSQARAIERETEIKDTKIKKDGSEAKCRRLNLVIEPSTWADFCDLAIMKKTKPNTLFCDVIADYVKDNAEALKQYRELLSKIKEL